MKNTITFRNTFTDCDDFAAYVLDHLTSFGSIVTAEFNGYLGLSLPVGSDIYKISDLPNTGKNYETFGTVKSWLYDLYKMYEPKDMTSIEIIEL